MSYLSVVFRLEPTPQQAAQMVAFAAACRTVWNLALEQRQTAWRRQRQFVGWAEQCRQVKDLRAEFPFFAKAPVGALHSVIQDLDTAYGNWWANRAEFPKWKSAKRSTPTFRIHGDRAAVLETGRHVRIAKIGRVRARISRALPGRAVRATVSFRNGHWWIAYACEAVALVRGGPRPAVGIDLGVARSVTLSTGEAFTAPKANDRRLAQLQRRVSRRVRRSRRHSKASRAVGRWYENTGNARKDFIAQFAHRLTRDYQLIALENLNVAGVTRGHRGLNRDLLHQAFGAARTRIEQKARQTGTTVVAVNPAYTSQTCSACGTVDRRSRESQACFRCIACGFELHADVNAAINILNKATAGQAGSNARRVDGLESSTLKREPHATSNEASHV